MTAVSVALVDDQPLFVESFRALCHGQANIELVATAATASAAASIVAQYRPHILFMDMASLEGSFEAVTTLSKLAPLVKVVALTAARSMAFAIRTLDAGVYGYVLKQSSGEDLALAIHAIGRGEKFITHGFANKIVAALQDATVRKKAARAIKLSIRENQVVRLLLSGKTNKEIALILAISEKTVKHYMTLLMQKLNVRNRVEVVIAAQQLEEADAHAERVH